MESLAGLEEYAAGTLTGLELAGTFVFALGGAAAGVKNRLDLFGLLVVSFATGAAGGITRHVLVADIPIVLRSDLSAVAALAALSSSRLAASHRS